MPADSPSPSSLPSLLLLLPLFSALSILLFKRLLKGASVAISVGSSAVCFVLALLMLGSSDSVTLIAPFIQVPGLTAALEALVDSQSRGMIFIVQSIGLLVHLFSLGYMKDDEARERFFGALSLFMFSMNGIVLAANLFMAFIFWELVGLSSFLLIGHWFEKPSAAEAAKKAFLTNRIGDFGFMIGILCLFMANHGDVSFSGLKESLASGPLHETARLHSGLMFLAAMGVFMGAVGKSAQFPLHVWLPDAMEGPTPVSALIHAATMVAAGVYMLVRCSFVIEASPSAALWIAWTGGITALMAALIAVRQDDIKRVLAYSTLSQLGYMVMAVGLVASQAGAQHDSASPGHPAMFHLYTHAFFKAMLFLGSGAVIYACHHEQNIWKMGGLRRHMPVTFATFALGTLALAGLPLTSGFFSKEAILGVAYEVKGPWLAPLFWIAVLTATLTAFYMTRMFCVAFLGKSRSEHASHATEVPAVMALPLVVLALLTLLSPWDWAARLLSAMKPDHAAPHLTVLSASLLALGVGVGGGWRLYRNAESDPLAGRPWSRWLENKFYFDELYQGIVHLVQDGMAWLISGLDRGLIDGLVARLPASIAGRFGQRLRALTGGQLQAYGFFLGLGLIWLIYELVMVLPLNPR